MRQKCILITAATVLSLSENEEQRAQALRIFRDAFESEDSELYYRDAIYFLYRQDDLVLQNMLADILVKYDEYLYGEEHRALTAPFVGWKPAGM